MASTMLGRNPVHVATQMSVNLRPRVVCRRRCANQNDVARCGSALPASAHAVRATSNKSFCLSTSRSSVVPAESVGPHRRAAHGFRPIRADQQWWASRLHWSSQAPLKNDRFGDLLPRPDSLHHRDALGHAAHRLGRGIRADGVVVLVAAADTEPDRQPTSADHIAGSELLGKHHRGMQPLRHHHDRRHQSHPIGPRRQRTEQRQALGIVERDPLAPAQRRERAAVDQRGPRPSASPRPGSAPSPAWSSQCARRRFWHGGAGWQHGLHGDHHHLHRARPAHRDRHRPDRGSSTTACSAGGSPLEVPERRRRGDAQRRSGFCSAASSITIGDSLVGLRPGRHRPVRRGPRRPGPPRVPGRKQGRIGFRRSASR